MIVKVETSAQGSTSVTVGDQEVVGMPDLRGASGVKIKNVPASSTNIDFYGNLPSNAVIPPALSEISAFRAKTTTILHQYHTNGGVGNVGIYGSGDIVKDSNDEYSAEFDSKAITSRIEIEKLVADDDVTGFSVKGIFINNFYLNSDYTGQDNSNLILYTMMSTYADGGETYYSGSYKGVTYDYDATGLGTLGGGGNYTPGSNRVWGYNMFAGAMPHVVIRLSDITHNDDQPGDPVYPDDMYITIRGFKVGGTEIPSIEAGYIYNLSTILVNDDTLNPLPEPEEAIEIDVKVNLIPWKKVEVEPVLPY